MILNGRIIRYSTDIIKNSTSVLIKLLSLSIKSPFMTDAEHIMIKLADMCDNYIFTNYCAGYYILS